MKTLIKIPFSLDAKQIMAQANVEADSSHAADLLSLIALAQEIGRPKAAYASCFVTERNDEKVKIDDVWFRSRTLAHNLKSIQRVFPFVATCGHEVDQRFSNEGDLLKEFWWDLIKMCLLDAAEEYLSDRLHRKFRLTKTATMHPGSADASVWPIEQQKNLFLLLGNVQEEIGVQLTESFLMLPNMTISGILFPTETDFHNCEVCHRENCPSRLAPFNKKLWEEIHHD
jgi:hypothetical protein